MMGDFATALLLMLTLVGELIVSVYLLVYGMHCVLTVVQETGDGQDEVVWPSGPYADWLFGGLHLVVLVVALLIPAGFLARGLKNVLFPNNDLLRVFVLAVPLLWLFFPIALLSSLSAPQRWMVLRPTVLGRMLRRAPSTLFVYVVSGLLAAGVAALWYASFTGGRLWLTPVAAAAQAAALLIYARLLGRLAWLMGRLPSAGRKRPAIRKKEKGEKKKGKAHDPWAVPDEPPPPTEEAKAKREPESEMEAYGMADEPVKPPPVEVGPPRKRERNTVTRRPPPEKKPSWPLFSGVWTFPWYSRSLTPWLLLVVGSLLTGVGARALVALYTMLMGRGE
jgi:hypothetical protein